MSKHIDYGNTATAVIKSVREENRLLGGTAFSIRVTEFDLVADAHDAAHSALTSLGCRLTERGLEMAYCMECVGQRSYTED